jgi:5,10-methylenetetrahydrofolate reductase
MFSKHIAALKGDFMNLTDMIAFFEEGYSLIQTLKADGTLAKLEAAEAAIQSELASNPNVQKLETMIESFFAKKVVASATAAQAPSGATGG